MDKVNETNKISGIVLTYDGHYGELNDKNGNTYVMLEKDVMNEGLTNNDEVLFIPETFKNEMEESLIARFIEKKECFDKENENVE